MKQDWKRCFSLQDDENADKNDLEYTIEYLANLNQYFKEGFAVIFECHHSLLSHKITREIKLSM